MKAFSVIVVVEVVEFHLSLSLSSERAVGSTRCRCEVLWKNIRPGAVRMVVNYSSNPLFHILELLRKDKVSVITLQVEDYRSPQMTPGMILINLDS